MNPTPLLQATHAVQCNRYVFDFEVRRDHVVIPPPGEGLLLLDDIALHRTEHTQEFILLCLANLVVIQRGH